MSAASIRTNLFGRLKECPCCPNRPTDTPRRSHAIRTNALSECVRIVLIGNGPRDRAAVFPCLFGNSPRTFGEPMANRRTNDHAWRSESTTTMANSAIPSHCGAPS